MNMIPTLQELCELSPSLLAEAARCVRVHGCGGIGDPYGADKIQDLKAAYVSMCVSCEQTRAPENILAGEVRAELEAAFATYRNKG